MENNKIKIKKINKSTSFYSPLYHSSDNNLNLTRNLIKIDYKTINAKNLFSVKKRSYKHNIHKQKYKLLRTKLPLINLPAFPNIDISKHNIFYNIQSNNLNKTRNQKEKIKINLKSIEKNLKGDLLFFDSSIKPLYENIKMLKNNRKYQEERKKKKNDLNFDYDENNYDIKHNSFSGNDPNLLKKKVIFVKNIFDYIYPKIVINRMKFTDKQKASEIQYQIKNLTKKFGNKYYIKRYKSPEENSIFSKFQLNGAVHDESIKMKGDFIKLKKVMVNGHSATQLAKHCDYINN